MDLIELAGIARAAGRAILGIYERDFSIAEKEDRSPLTEADLASHRVIVEALQQLTPDLPILSEESASIPFESRRSWHRYWLVDPLDGTKEFIKRNGEFTVNIALVEDGRVAAGVIYVPAQDTLYFGCLEAGCWKGTAGAELAPIKVREADHNTGLTVVMSRSHPSPELEKYLQEVNVSEALPVGSSLKLCVVAEGKADLYPRLGPTMEWDTAAGHAIVEAAGGTVLTEDGTPLRYNKESLLNPHFIVRGR